MSILAESGYSERWARNIKNNIGAELSKRNEGTGWPKSNVSKVRAYCSASDHLIGKISSGVYRDSHWFEEYLKIIEIGDYFFE